MRETLSINFDTVNVINTSTTLLFFQEKTVRPLPPQPPETPSPSVGMSVIAEYNFAPVTPQDLELRKDEEYTILEMSDQNWWKARDKYG